MNETTNDTNDQSVAQPSPLEADQRYRFVRGWLLLLCLVLIVFDPILTSASFIRACNDLSQYFDQYPGVLVAVFIDAFFSVMLTVFSIYAGFSLWLIKSRAVQRAKRYLVCFLVYLGIAAILPFIAGFPPEAGKPTIYEIIRSTILGIGYFAVLYSYLCKSKRVKATYARKRSFAKS